MAAPDVLVGPTRELPAYEPGVLAQAYSDILDGYRVPTYTELTAVGAYVDRFTVAARSSMHNGLEIWSNTLPDGTRQTVTSTEMDSYRHTVDPRTWRLSDERRSELEAVLAADATPEALDGQDPFDLIARQNEAERWIGLDAQIRDAELRTLRVNSRHAVRRGLGASATAEELRVLADASLGENLSYIRTAPALTLRQQEIANKSWAASREAEEAANAQPEDTPRPTSWQRVRRVTRAILTLGLEA